MHLGRQWVWINIFLSAKMKDLVLDFFRWRWTRKGHNENANKRVYEQAIDQGFHEYRKTNDNNEQRFQPILVQAMSAPIPMCDLVSLCSSRDRSWERILMTRHGVWKRHDDLQKQIWVNVLQMRRLPPVKWPHVEFSQESRGVWGRRQFWIWRPR